MKMLKLKNDEKDYKRRDVFLENLKGAVEAEHHLGRCCRHIGSLIKNGTVKAKCEELASGAEEAEKKLQGVLEAEGVDFKIEHTCKFCRLKPDNFSLEGAINLGLEIVRAAIDCYRCLIRVSEGKDHVLFVELLKKKLVHRKALLKEKRFNHSKTQGGIIDDFCMPHIISKLWR